MDIVDRYLQTVRVFLPKRQRDDIVNELEEEIRSQVARKEADLQRRLTADERAAVLEQYGHPLLLAARYRPQRSLIGPVLFPYYALALNVIIGLVVAGHVLSGVVGLAADPSSVDLGQRLADLAGAVLRIVGWITLLAAGFDFWLSRSRVLEDWTPAAMLPLPQVDSPVRRALSVVPGRSRTRPRADAPSLSRFVVLLVLSAWWLLGLRFPVLFFGSGAADLEWGAAMDRMYPVLVVAQTAMLADHLARLTRPHDARIAPVIGAVWLIAGWGLIYAVATSDHQWLVWHGEAEARARANVIARIAGREFPVIDLVNSAFSIPFIFVAVGAVVSSARMLVRWFQRHARAAAAVVSIGIVWGAVESQIGAQSTNETSVLPSDAEIRRLLADRIDGKRQSLGIIVGIVTAEGRRLIAYGRRGHDDPRPVDGDTVFEIGSVTKVFTSLLLADMVQRGEVALTDPAARYLPQGASIARRDGRTITLVDLATHTAGLPFWPSNIPPTAEGVRSMGSYTVDQLYEFLPTVAVAADVGSRWAYSNVDAGLLGLVLGRRAGSSYGALLAERVTGPLKMTSTAIEPSPDMRSRLAVGHDRQLNVAPRWDVPALAAAGSLHSTASDLLTFLEAAIGHTRSPLAPAMAAMLDTRRPGPAFQQALGWWIFTEGKHQLVTHVGGTLGFASQIAYEPGSRIGIVVLSNTVNPISDITKQLLRPGPPSAAPAGVR